MLESMSPALHYSTGAVELSPTTCIHCGAALNRPGVKFCPKCGKAQEGSAQQPTVTSVPTAALAGDAADAFNAAAPASALVAQAQAPAAGDLQAARGGGELPRLVIQD